MQRVRKALDPPGEARDDGWIISAIAERMGFDWGQPTAEEAWDELRSLSPMHRGMSYDKLEALGGIQWPCPDEESTGSPFLHARLWAEPLEGEPAPFSPVEHKPPYEALDAEYPIRLTTGRRLESYNTGVQTNRYRSPLHRGESLDLSPEDAERMLLEEGEIVRVSSRRGSVETPVHIDPSLRPGLAFMTFHFPDQVDTNLLTIDVTDPKSGTAEFKACAVRVDKLAAPRAAGQRARRRARDDPRRLMDIHLLDAAPTAAERAAVEHVLGPPAGGWDGGVARLRPAGPLAARRRARGALAPAPAAARAALGAGARRLDQPGRAQPHRRAADGAAGRRLRRGDVLRAAQRRAAPAARVHVCEDLACRCNGSQELIAQLEEHLGAEGELNADGSATWLRSPCLGQCDRAPAAMLTLAGEQPEEHVLAPVTAQQVLAAIDGREVDDADPVTPLPQAGDDSLRLLARVGRVDPIEPRRLPRRRAATRRCGARSSWAARA